MTTRTKTSNTGQRVLDVLKILRGHSLDGLSNKDIAAALGCPASAVTRATTDLIEAGLAVKLENGRFAHSVQMLQIAVAHSREIEKANSRISELNQRIAAGAHN